MAGQYIYICGVDQGDRLSYLKDALKSKVFDKNVKKKAENYIETNGENSPLWVKVLAGGNLAVPNRVVMVAQDIKEWAEQEKDDGSYIQ